ncbi:hypothetical protein E4U17_001319 [Claviceps sp. LM77 group G4]|nr:hypothetical protein E4U17_001319 [Claviceps sp. LM77 group G4]KAG6072960.1 hypothetical protein E4U33_003103 [Claviceps sp. LM78 group G4]KAG6074906.1 hypothetical protein E4U16_003687 [Claviceps sp. LM84 group G4]
MRKWDVKMRRGPLTGGDWKVQQSSTVAAAAALAASPGASRCTGKKSSAPEDPEGSITRCQTTPFSRTSLALLLFCTPYNPLEVVVSFARWKNTILFSVSQDTCTSKPFAGAQAGVVHNTSAESKLATIFIQESHETIAIRE